MTARTTSLLDRIEHERQAVLADVNELGSEQLVFRPEAGSWSALEVVEHLVKVEEGIVSHVKKREPRTWGEAARGRLSLEVVSVCFRLGRRLRVPVQAIMPQGGATLSDLDARWVAAQEAMRRTVGGFGPGEYARPMMRHP